MRRDLATLSSTPNYDLCIIGGGVNGLAAAWDASLRGLHVALVEKGDFGGATSSASLKIIHGGLRYLQHLDLVRMREHIAERRALQRIAPHLVEPFPFLVPTYGLGMAGRPAMRAAMLVNDLVSLDRNRGLPRHRRIPRGRTLGREAVLGIAPGLDPKGLTGGAVFHDARVHNTERFNLLFAIAAEREGAHLANYVEVTGFRRTGRNLHAVTCRDLIAGDAFEVRARSFLNMTGPWTEQVMALASPELASPPALQYSAGFQIISPQVSRDGMGLAVSSRHVDPDAKVKRGGRHYFATPWRGRTIWGTTDHLYEGAPEQWHIREEDIEAFLAEINTALPGVRLERSAVVHAYGGLRPVEGKNLNKGSQVSRHYQLHDHAKDLALDNFVSLRGVKYTACRLMAERSLDLVLRKLGRRARACTTATTPLPGAGAVPIAPDGLPPELQEHLARTYGSEASAVFHRMDSEPADQARLGDSWVTRAEIREALTDESALTLSDLVFRRTELATLGHPGSAALATAAHMMSEARGWDASFREAEIAAVETRLLPVPL